MSNSDEIAIVNDASLSTSEGGHTGILVALDLAEPAASDAVVLHHAAALARATKEPLWLLHVAAPDPDFVGYGAGPQSVRDAVAARFREEHRRLQHLAHQLRAEGTECTALLVQGPTAAQILAEAKRVGASMIVMGARPRQPLRILVLGSTSRDVLARADRPVLVVPASASE
jgi:nucleotide-binding universal stress UspA family protein